MRKLYSLYANLRTRTKLALFATAAVAWILTLGMFSLWSAREIATGITEARASGLTTTAATIAEVEIGRLRMALVNSRGVDDPESLQELVVSLNKQAETVEKAVLAADNEEFAAAHSQGIDKLLGEAKTGAAEIKAGTAAYVQDLVSATPEGGKLSSVLAAIDETAKTLNESRVLAQKEADKMLQRDMSVYHSLVKITWGLIALASFLSAAFGFLVSKIIGGQVRRIEAAVEKVAAGDLTAVVEIPGDDDLCQLSHHINDMVGQTRLVIASLIKSSRQVEASAEVVHSGSIQVATAAEEIAAQAGTVAVAAEEMAATAHEIANNCHMAAENANTAENIAGEGSSVAEGAVHQMDAIAESTRHTVATVERLAQRSEEIGEIIDTIEDIADQTNLLALNAAIEAARAGDAGRGFAVVADEVRRLSERTTAATKEISGKIKAIQSETGATISAIRDDAGKIQQGSSDVTQAGNAIMEIRNQVGGVTQQIGQIATAAEEQSATTTEITNNMQQISEVVATASERAQASAAESRKLVAMIEELEHIAGKFNVGNAEAAIMVETARRDHIAFVERVEKALKGEIALKAGDLPDHHGCRFGKWYDGQSQSHCAQKPAWKAIVNPHAELHQLAKEALNAKGTRDAEKLLKRIKELSKQIIENLSLIERECR